MPDEIPQSNSLSEASPESLSELFSRDPEGYTTQDRPRVIEALRNARVRWIQAQVDGATTKKPRAPKLSEALAKTPKSLDEMGF